jgi:uncharacterized membrane protein
MHLTTAEEGHVLPDCRIHYRLATNHFRALKLNRCSRGGDHQARRTALGGSLGAGYAACTGRWRIWPEKTKGPAMTILILGLLMFLGVHSVRIVADDWRASQVARLGLWPWKGVYSLVSVAGFALIVWGYGLTRGQAELWLLPPWLRQASSLLMLVSFVLFVAVYVPRNRVKAAIGHPMAAGTKVWALAHLLTNGRPGDVLLFGAFLVWAVLVFRAARARDRASGTRYPAGTYTGDMITLVVGVAAWVVFARYLHAWLVGVPVA